MANTFLTPDVIAREALMRLRNRLVMGRLVYRDHTQEWTGAKKGDTVTIRRPASFTANEFTSTISVQNASETGIALTLEKHFDVSVAVTSKDWTLELEQFSEQIVAPAMEAIAQGVDSYVHSKYTQIPYFVGVAATPAPPAIWSDVVAIRRKLLQQQVPMTPGMVHVVLDPVAEASVLNLDQFHAADKRGDGGSALRQAITDQEPLSTVLGMNWWVSQNVKQHTKGTFDDGTTAINSAVSAGAKLADVDGGATSGTVVIGDLFTVANDTGQYAVTANATATTGAIAGMAFTPGAATSMADSEAITWVASHRANLAFHRNAFALAVVPLELPQGANRAAIQNFEGLSIRTVFGYDMSTKTDTISFDLLAGCVVQQPELAVRVLG